MTILVKILSKLKKAQVNFTRDDPRLPRDSLHLFFEHNCADKNKQHMLSLLPGVKCDIPKKHTLLKNYKQRVKICENWSKV